jgi:hypothetical protein
MAGRYVDLQQQMFAQADHTACAGALFPPHTSSSTRLHNRAGAERGRARARLSGSMRSSSTSYLVKHTLAQQGRCWERPSARAPVGVVVSLPTTYLVKHTLAQQGRCWERPSARAPVGVVVAPGRVVLLEARVVHLGGRRARQRGRGRAAPLQRPARGLPRRAGRFQRRQRGAALRLQRLRRGARLQPSSAASYHDELTLV